MEVSSARTSYFLLCTFAFSVSWSASPRCPSPARSAPRRTCSTRGSAGTARAARCCGSGSAGRRAGRGRRPRRASARCSGRPAAAAGRARERLPDRLVQRPARAGCGRALRTAARAPRRACPARRGGAPSASRARQSCGFAAISLPAQRGEPAGARRLAYTRPRAARTRGRRARATRRSAAPRPRPRPRHRPAADARRRGSGTPARCADRARSPPRTGAPPRR